MNSKFQKQLLQLDQSLTEMLEKLKDFSDDQLNRPPKKGGWSAIQVMHHLLLAERLSLAYVLKKLSFQPELKRAGLEAMMRSQLLNLYLGLPFKFEAPPHIGTPALPERASFWETAKSWKQERQKLQQFLKDLPSDLDNKALYKHPFAGRISLGNMLSFFQAHFYRHRKQIFRVLDEY
ncbi:MAG: DinB family protein [Bacteroidota bacterium]